MIRSFLSVVLFLLIPSLAVAETVRFKAQDGVEVTAEFKTPQAGYNAIIVLYHMAGASRGEYRDIAQRLNRQGYATLAVDQRSGGAFNGVRNETAAKSGGRVDFVKAIPDMTAAAAWARANTDASRVGVLGSSYSAGLVLVLAAQDKGFADAVMAFSPGEYYGASTYVSDQLEGIIVPVFLTAARAETGQWTPFAARIQSDVTGFKPDAPGKHGASVLDSADGPEYWSALTAFLNIHLPAR